MRTFWIGVAATLAVLLVFPAASFAKDKRGSFGVGGDTTLGGVSGLSARYQFAKNFGFQGVVGFDLVSVESQNDEGDKESDLSVSQLRLALRGDLSIAPTTETNLGIVFGVDIYNDSSSIDPVEGDAQDDGNTRFAFEVGLKIEYFFTNFFSIHTEAGLAFAFINDPGAQALLGDGPRVGGNNITGSLLTFGRADLLGNAGVTFWFK